MRIEPKAYFNGIEKKIIEHILSANSSIRIAMAWFTSNEIKESLIEKKRTTPNTLIEIVVDKNGINDKYFLNYKTKFDQSKIKLWEKVEKRFLHDKFMIIDKKITITGSYNYSNKAQSNLENIVVIHSKSLSSFYSRKFTYIISKNYIDENVKLLFDFPKFAQSILSTYYMISKNEYQKYKDKIQIGCCFTHENGLYDEIKYSPGFLFNPNVRFLGNIKNHEFNLPINKDLIKGWTRSRNENLIIDYYSGRESEYEYINEELEKNEKKVEILFRRKMEHTYSSSQLKAKIQNGIDIVLEDDLWINNFEPFLNKELIERIFSSLVSLEEKESCKNQDILSGEPPF